MSNNVHETSNGTSFNEEGYVTKKEKRHAGNPLKGMGATFRLLNTYFWRTYYGPILAFVLPQLFLAILGNVFKVEYTLPGIISLSIMLIGVLALPLGMMELKNSTLLKYIGTTKISKGKFVMTAIFYYVAIIFVSVVFSIVLSLALFSSEIFLSDLDGGFKAGLFSGLFSVVGFFNFLFALILATAFSVSVGMAIASFSKTPQQALTISLIISLISMFLAGMIVSVDIIAESPILQWISRFVPFRYTTGNLIVSMTPLPQTEEFLKTLGSAERGLIFTDEFKVIAEGEFQYTVAGQTETIVTTQDLRDSEMHHQFEIFNREFPDALRTLIAPLSQDQTQISDYETYLTATAFREFQKANPSDSALNGFSDYDAFQTMLSTMGTQDLLDIQSNFDSFIADHSQFQTSSMTWDIDDQMFWDFMNDGGASRYKTFFGVNFHSAWDLVRQNIGDAEYAKMIKFTGDDVTKGIIKSRTLYQALFVDSPVIRVSGTSNNVFDWTHNWGVRRIPSVAAVKDFTTKFLTGDPVAANSFNADTGNILDLAGDVSKGDFDFLDLFTKQTSELYTIPDKVLNVLLPVAGMGLLQWYTAKNFNWSAR